MKTLYIDPGTKALGAAMFEDRELIEATCSRSKVTMLVEEYLMFHMENLKYWIFEADEVVIERMVYRAQDKRSNPNSLLDVQLIAAGIAGACRTPVVTLKPSEWKSALPKAIHHVRIRSVLSEKERLLLDARLEETIASHHKEVLDAVGIGLFHSKRTRKDGSRARR